MRIRSVFHPSAMCVGSADTLRHAADLMRAGGYGALPVYDGDRLAGIFTERDMVAAIAGGTSAERATVSEWMSTDLVVADPEEDSLEVAGRMLVAGARHLPVVEGGRLVGMVSARDLLLLEAWPPARAGEGRSG